VLTRWRHLRSPRGATRSVPSSTRAVAYRASVLLHDRPVNTKSAVTRIAVEDPSIARSCWTEPSRALPGEGARDDSNGLRAEPADWADRSRARPAPACSPRAGDVPASAPDPPAGRTPADAGSPPARSAAHAPMVHLSWRSALYSWCQQPSGCRISSVHNLNRRIYASRQAPTSTGHGGDRTTFRQRRGRSRGCCANQVTGAAW
jgi:hypothetical protein